MARKHKGKNITETDLANERMGKNSMQGNDQRNIQNQRHAVAEVRQKTDGVIESFEKLDKDKRARTDLGKGNRDGSNNSD